MTLFESVLDKATVRKVHDTEVKIKVVLDSVFVTHLSSEI